MSDKTVIVTEAGGRERHYSADDWTAGGNHALTIEAPRGPHRIDIATYAPGAWLSVREGDAEIPDPVKRALAITRRALRDILTAADDIDQPFGRPEITKIAADALDDAGLEEADL